MLKKNQWHCTLCGKPLKEEDEKHYVTICFGHTFNDWLNCTPCNQKFKTRFKEFKAKLQQEAKQND